MIRKDSYFEDALTLYSHGTISTETLNHVYEIGIQALMLCKVEFKDSQGKCYIKAEYDIYKYFFENEILRELNKIIASQLSVYEIPVKGKKGWIDVECWDYVGKERMYPLRTNTLLKTIRLKLNPFKFNLGVLEFIFDSHR